MNERELLKENVEPIKWGQNIKILKSALNQKPNELNAKEFKRKEFEYEFTCGHVLVQICCPFTTNTLFESNKTTG